MGQLWQVDGDFPTCAVTQIPWDHADARRLLREYADERRATVGFDDPPDADSPDQYEPPDGMFLIAYAPEQLAVACGGFRRNRFRENAVEIRKMYVAPEWRGRGLGRQLLIDLEHCAAALGADEITLETGSYNAIAMHLYTSSGYEAIPAYVPNRPSFNRAFAKTIARRT